MTALPRIAALYLACVAIWGSTWLAITFQLGSVPPAVSVLYRFALAAVLLFGYCLVRRLPLAFGTRQHAALAVQGTLIYSIGYVFVYYAETRVVSGLVSLGFSLSPFLNMIAVRLFLRTPTSARVAVGGLLGAAGVALGLFRDPLRLGGLRARGADVALQRRQVRSGGATGRAERRRSCEPENPLPHALSWKVRCAEAAQHGGWHPLVLWPRSTRASLTRGTPRVDSARPPGLLRAP